MHPFPTGQTAPDPANPARRIPILQQKATLCDLCSDLKDGQPSCVYACPHDAAHRMTGADLIKKVERRVIRS
jgi:Fe-S-cluster-containing hydrogenase component 2